jgi:hypothetical protein
VPCLPLTPPQIISETTESLIEETGDADQDEEMDFLERVFEMRGTLLHEQKGSVPSLLWPSHASHSFSSRPAYKIAVVDFGKAIALRPNRAENYYFRGSCQCKLGNFERVCHVFISPFISSSLPSLSGDLRLHDC